MYVRMHDLLPSTWIWQRDVQGQHMMPPNNRRIHRPLRVEELEPRIAPVILNATGQTLEFTDGDGDLVRVTFSGSNQNRLVSIVGAAGGTPGTAGNPYITSVYFYSQGSTNTTLLIDVIGGTGDGLTPAGAVTAATNVDVGSILVEGPITSFSGRRIATALRSDYDGAVASIGTVNITSTQSDFSGTLSSNGDIGSVTITRSLSGTIYAGGDLGSVTINGGSGITSAASITAVGQLTGTISATAGPIAGSITVGAMPGGAILCSANMDIDPGWTGQGQWAFGQPTGQGGDHGNPDPTSGYTGTNVYGYNLNGAYPNNMWSTRYLTTTAINCVGYDSVSLEFMNWLGVERSSYDHASLQVSNNGSTWTTLWSNPDTSRDGGSWSSECYDISSVAANQATVYIRWGMGTTDSSWTYCGWNIDDVLIRGGACSEIKTASGYNITGAITVTGDMGGRIASGGTLGNVTVSGANGITSTAVIRSSGALNGAITATAGPIAGAITVGSMTGAGAIRTTAPSGQDITGQVTVQGDMAGQITSTRSVLGAITIGGNMASTGVITAGSASLPGYLWDVTVRGTTGIISGAKITAYGLLCGWISAPNGANNGTINVGGFRSMTAWTISWYDSDSKLQWSDTFGKTCVLISKNPAYVETQGYGDTIYYDGTFKAGTSADETVYGCISFDGWYMTMDGWKLVMGTAGASGFVPGQGGVTTSLALGVDFSTKPDFDLDAFKAVDTTSKDTDKYYFSIHIAGGSGPLDMVMAGEMVIPKGGVIGAMLHWDPLFDGDADDSPSVPSSAPHGRGRGGSVLDRAMVREIRQKLRHKEVFGDLRRTAWQEETVVRRVANGFSNATSDGLTALASVQSGTNKAASSGKAGGGLGADLMPAWARFHVVSRLNDLRFSVYHPQ